MSRVNPPWPYASATTAPRHATFHATLHANVHRCLHGSTLAELVGSGQGGGTSVAGQQQHPAPVQIDDPDVILRSGNSEPDASDDPTGQALPGIDQRVGEAFKVVSESFWADRIVEI